MQKDLYTTLCTWKRQLWATVSVLSLAGIATAQPVISTVSPGSGNTGSSVTIAGSGFNTTAANNRVYFGATRGTVTSASGSSLNVTVPLGATYSHVSVNNAGTNLTGFSKSPFVPTFDNSGYLVDTTNFEGVVNFVTASDSINDQQADAVLGDIDGDGKLDIVVGYPYVHAIAIYRNVSTIGTINSSSFASRIDVPISGGCWGLSLGDLDGDGKLDIITVGGGILGNNCTPGTITSSSFTEVPLPYTGANKIIDMNGDGKPDIVSNAGFVGMQIQINTSTAGSISFDDPWTFYESGFLAGGPMADYWSLAVGDIDGDGKPDVALTTYNDTRLTVYRNNFSSGAISDESMDPSVTYTCEYGANGVAIGDIDGDGKQEIVVGYVSYNSQLLSIFRNTATAGSITASSLASRVDIWTGGEPWGMGYMKNIDLADMNGDGKLDIITTNANDDTWEHEITVMRNVATAGTIDASSFIVSQSVLTPSIPLAIAIGDIDGDGIPDIAVASSPNDVPDHHKLSVIRNSPLPAGMYITGEVSICQDATSTLSCSIAGGTWSSGDATIATVGSSTGIVEGIAPGTATISYTTSGGTATAVVTVNTTPTVSAITGTATLCAGSTTTLNNATSGGLWSGGSVNATVSTFTGVVTGYSNGTALITYAVSTACGTAMATKMVTVGATSSITGTLSLCAGTTSSLSGGTTGGVWSSSNTAVATIGAANGVLTAVNTGTANITYTVSGGCTATAIVTVSMPAIIAGTSNTCVGQTATLTDATSGGTWSSANTALATVDATTGVVTGIAAGSPTISYYVSTGCYRTITFTVKALPPAIAGPVAVCEGSTVYVAPPSTNGQSWSSSNTSVAVIGSSTGMLTGVTAGTTTLTYTTVTGCFVTTTATVNAGPGVIAGTLALCSGSSSSLSNPTTGGTWSSSNNSVASIGSATGVVTAGSTGTATITYNTSGCRAIAIVTVSPIAAITGTPSMCVGSSATLNNTTSGGTWSSSNTGIAIVGTSGIVTGIATGNATITYTIASGCTRTVTATVVATPGAITGSLSICPATTATLSGGTPGGSWSGGNASIATINSSTGVLSGIGAGTINVSYTLTGCRVTAIATVNPQPALITGTTNACVAQTSTLNNATSGGAWSSNNTGIATVDASTGIVTGVSAATTTMTYTLGTGCYRTISFTVKALPPAIVTTAAACVGTSTYMAPPSTNGRSWSSSNTAVATIGSSTGMLAGVSVGTTILTYTTTTGCYVTTEATVYALPSAGTITGPSSVVVGNTITLDDVAAGGVWSSSNTAKATIGAGTGIVTGVAGGVATISYSVSNPGCTVRATKAISVLTSRPGGNAVSADNLFQLYPNPTTGVFTVEADEAGTFSIYSLDGKEVNRHNITAGANQFSLPGDLASGIYMCRFTGESGNATMARLVFER